MAILPKLDQFLTLIEDGAWHNLKNLSKQTNVPEHKIKTISKLLSKINMINTKQIKTT